MTENNRKLDLSCHSWINFRGIFTMYMHGITFSMHPICHTIIIVNFTDTPPTYGSHVTSFENCLLQTNHLERTKNMCL